MTVRNDLRRYLAMLSRWAWLLTLAALLAGSAAYIFSIRQPPLYEASTTILIEEAPGTTGQPDYTSIMTSGGRERTRNF